MRFTKKAKTITAVLLVIISILSLCACSETIETETLKEYPELPEGAVDIFFLSVGKGDAAIIHSSEATYMVDTADNNKESTVLNALTIVGATKLDGLFLSHDHDDHIGNFKAIYENFGIDIVYYPAVSILNKKGENVIKEKAKKLGVEKDALRAGDSGTLAGGIEYEVLGPISGDSDDNNNNSMIIRFTVNGKKVLFTGDAEFSEEQTLLDAGVDLDADILKVANHGNPDATSKELVAAITPEVAVISTSRAVDPDSANQRVLTLLSGVTTLITDTVSTGILVRIMPDGAITTYKINP